ncbi:MAG: carbohydrate-binding protein [Bacteroidales bacterium]|nr:carbohydrate-binding protein [Bacteroidales bacterium]
MKKQIINSIFLFFVLSFFVPLSAQWELVWSDEFNYSGYPDGHWSPEVWNPGVVNNELQYYTANLDNASVSNGTLKIKAASDGSNYYSARLNSTSSWTYGRFEARMLLPGGWGTWPAFWLYPDNDFYYGTNSITNYGWPNCGEIDIMEEVGYDQNVIHASTHSACCFWAVGTQRTGTITVSDPTTNWHVYSCNWYEDRLEFFVDGTNYFTVWNDWTGWESWPFNYNFHIILNLAVGGDWGGAQGVDPNIWPRTLEVDYVRVYRHTGSDSGTDPGGTCGSSYTSVPATIQAEDYCDMTGIQTETTTDAGGGQNVGWIDANDYIAYSINVPSAGSYTVNYRVASQNGGGSLRLESYGGGTNFGELSVPGTGGWQTWTTISHNVNLPAGQQTIAILATAGGWNLNWFSIESGGSTNPPANTTYYQIPGTIQAEDYSDMSGIDLESTSDDGGGQNVGWIDNGDWMVYNVNVASSGTYTVNYRVASQNGGGSIRLEQAGGGTVYGTIGVPGTGGWQSWTTISHTVTLSAGQQQIGIYASAGGFNINWFSFTSGGSTAPPATDPPVSDSWSALIEAEDYALMNGIQTESCSEGGENVGWIDAGDWMIWDVNIPSSGTHTIEYRVASQNGGGSIQFEQAGGGNVYGTISVPGTGGWQNWTTISHTVTLSAGQQQVAIYVPAGGYNINWLQITQGVKSALDENSSLSQAVTVIPNPVDNIANIKGMPEGSYEIRIYDMSGRLTCKFPVKDISTVTIDISDLNKGMYILTVLTNSGIESAVKFTKQ